MTATRTLIPLSIFSPLVLGIIAALALTAPARSVTGLQYPDLGMAPLSEFTLDKPSNGSVLLRFSATIVNVGAGAMEVTATRADTSSSWAASQRIYGADGSSLVSVPGVSLVWSGDGHNHWHVNNIERYELFRLDNGVVAPNPDRVGAKAGFCFFDTTQYRLTLPGAPTSRVYSSAATSPIPACAILNPSALDVRMGISVGWGDKYAYNIPGQYIDVTGLSSCKYRPIST